MKKYLITSAILIAAFFVCLSNSGLAQDKAAKDGKTIFTEAKCNTCHAISIEKIEPASKKKNVPDLSDVGTKLKADFMHKYLKKEETLNDKKHLVAFKGDDADLEILVKWMESLKTKPE
ncbi:MAG: hypothetical protein QG635_1320 [Bacteroidota bacterium]|nr:hypothetical protein [Bacteroidota bacterium]